MRRIASEKFERLRFWNFESEIRIAPPPPLPHYGNWHSDSDKEPAVGAPLVGARGAPQEPPSGVPTFLSVSCPLLWSLCDNPGLRVIPRSRRRRGILHCLENTQSEIPRSARNDSVGRAITQTPLGRRATRSIHSPSRPDCRPKKQVCASSCRPIFRQRPKGLSVALTPSHS